MYLIMALIYGIFFIVGLFFGLFTITAYTDKINGNETILKRYITPIFTKDVLGLAFLCTWFILFGLAGFYPTEMNQLFDIIYYYVIKIISIQI